MKRGRKCNVGKRQQQRIIKARVDEFFLEMQHVSAAASEPQTCRSLIQASSSIAITEGSCKDDAESVPVAAVLNDNTSDNNFSILNEVITTSHSSTHNSVHDYENSVIQRSQIITESTSSYNQGACVLQPSASTPILDSQSSDESHYDADVYFNESSSSSSLGETSVSNCDDPDIDYNIYNNPSIDGSSKNDDYESNVKESLIDWVLQCNIPRNHVSNLLKRLKNDCKLDFLPADRRTLLSSSRQKVELAKVPPGQYSHLNTKASLQGVLHLMIRNGHDIPDCLSLIINIDGIPVSKSSRSEFWPILFKVQGWPEIFVAGVYHGPGKPNDCNQFLKPFRDDVVELKKDGILFNGRKVNVRISAMSSDSPAASFVLNIKQHGSYFGCRKCETKGIWVKNVITSSRQTRMGGRVTYPQIDAPLRSDTSFRGRHQEEHHNVNGERSLFEDIVDDLIEDVPLDYMHLVCIGVYKKTIEERINGKFDNVRLSANSVLSISSFRNGIRRYVPSKNFARLPRPLFDLPRWKATEFRQDLMYICPVAYKGHLSHAGYQHLMLLHTAIKLLSRTETCREYASYAKSLLEKFVDSGSKLFGPQFIVHNVHNLIHLPNDVLKHGPLDSFSAFPFENKLQKLKNLIRKSGKPLQQLVKRLEEIDRYTNSKPSVEDCVENVKLTGVHELGPTVSQFRFGTQFKCFNSKNLLFSLNISENCVFLNNDVVVIVENIIEDLNDEVFILGRRFLKYEDMYDYPLRSSILHEFMVSQLSPELEVFSINVVKCRAFRIPTTIPEKGIYFVCHLLNENHD